MKKIVLAAATRLPPGVASCYSVAFPSSSFHQVVNNAEVMGALHGVGAKFGMTVRPYTVQLMLSLCGLLHRSYDITRS